jgi:UDP-3-O-[3-hydroxymyristoyl] glucosamine N-acyltransferase
MKTQSDIGGEKGDYVILKNNPIIEKGVILQDFVIVGKDGSQKAIRRTRIGEGSRILTGAIVYNGCNIGRRCLIAALVFSLEENGLKNAVISSILTIFLARKTWKCP